MRRARSTFTISVDTEGKQLFQEWCKNEGKKPSRVIDEFMKDIVNMPKEETPIPVLEPIKSSGTKAIQTIYVDSGIIKAFRESAQKSGVSISNLFVGAVTKHIITEQKPKYFKCWHIQGPVEEWKPDDFKNPERICNTEFKSTAIKEFKEHMKEVHHINEQLVQVSLELRKNKYYTKDEDNV